jgi:hypothetical protein
MPKIADELERLNATLTATASELRASNARPAPTPSAGPPGATALTWKATLARIAEQHLQIDLRDPRGADARDVHPVAVGALHAALRAAFRAGIAAGVGCLRATPCAGQTTPAKRGSRPVARGAKGRARVAPRSRVPRGRAANTVGRCR